MQADGYMMTAYLDEGTLRVVGDNKVSKAALDSEWAKRLNEPGGSAHVAGEVSLPVGEIERTEWKDASMLTNGRIDLFARGVRFQFHFRKKTAPQCQALFAALETARANTPAIPYVAPPPRVKPARAPKPVKEPKTPETTVIFGDGNYRFDVVGESFHARELTYLISTGSPIAQQQGELFELAMLVPEPKNQHDRHAVAVYIRGVHVGYAPAEMATSVTAFLHQYVPKGQIAGTPAKIGWNPRINSPKIGVWLDFPMVGFGTVAFAVGTLTGEWDEPDHVPYTRPADPTDAPQA